MLNQIPFKGNPLASVAPIFRSANLAIANLESPLTKAKVPTRNKSAAELKARSQFLLKADPRWAQTLAADGIRMVSDANNHCMDYGGTGLAEMLKALDASKIVHAGAGQSAAESSKTAVFTLPNGYRIGLVSALAFVGTPALRKCTPATDKRPGIYVLNFAGRIDKRAHAKLKSIVAAAHRVADFVIIGLHWGIERQTLPTSYQVQLGRACVDEGADLVWGNHPHVLQGAEIYKGKPILYSMGNLISPLPAETALVKLTFQGSQLLKFEDTPCRVGGYRVKPNPKGRDALKSASASLRKRFPNPRGRYPWGSNPPTPKSRPRAQ